MIGVVRTIKKCTLLPLLLSVDDCCNYKCTLHQQRPVSHWGDVITALAAAEVMNTAEKSNGTVRFYYVINTTNIHILIGFVYYRYRLFELVKVRYFVMKL